MKRLLMFLLASALAFGQGIEGKWQGTLEAGAAKLRINVDLTRTGGTIAGKLQSPDQSPSWIDMDAVTLTGEALKFEITRIGGSYSGKVGRDEIQGQWSQGAASLPLVLHRAPAEPPTSDSAAAKKPPMASHAPLTGIADKGVFPLYVNEERIGSAEVEIREDGSLDGTLNIEMAGQKVTTRTRVTTGKDGQIAGIEMETPNGKVTSTREGGTLRVSFKEKTTVVEIKPDARVLYGNFPPMLAHAIRLYDEAKGGKQTFPLLSLPGTALEASLERKDDADRTIGGKDARYKRYVYTLAGVDLIVWVNPRGKVDYVDVPQQHAYFVREGYEVLRKDPLADASVSQPTFDLSVDAGTKVAMRDKVRLSTDIYRPKAEGKFPVILIRTPYKKEMVELQARYYARRGYAVAVQDCRGRFGSEGTWEPFVNEPKDGYDTVEWLAAQPWSSGKVGMIGGSYVGWVQWWAASQKPPHLVTIIPNVAPPDPFYNIPYEYGVFFAYGSIWWADVLESQATADISGVTISKIFEKKYGKLMKELPVIDLDRRILGRENPYWRTWLEHPNNDSYWDRANFLDKLKDVRIPVFHQSGWFDGDGIGTKLNYQKMASYGHPNQKLVLGPWGHSDSSARGIGDRDFGPGAIVDLQRDYLRWFDRWLKGTSNGIEKEPLVRIFVMGSNKWLTGDKYPLPETKMTKLYLASGGNANTSKGDGKLTFEPPSAGAPPDKYTYDPGDPTPDPRWYETSEEEDKIVKTQDQRKKEVQEYHQQRIGVRKDILIYETEKLDKPLTFAGPVSAVLYAATSARDTDWFISLAEIDKDGKPFPLGQGKIRARFRKSMSRPEFLKRGEINEYALDLWQTGITIPAGHKLRIEVASASFPLFSRNLNTGGNNEVDTKFVSAEQTVYHNAKYPSHLLLPVIEMGAAK